MNYSDIRSLITPIIAASIEQVNFLTMVIFHSQAQQAAENSFIAGFIQLKYYYA